MNIKHEMQQINAQLVELRESVSGLTFSDAPERFKDIESLKVRKNILRNPNFYRGKYGRYGAVQ